MSEFRKSCLRHSWPPDSDVVQDTELDLSKLRQQVHTTNEALLLPIKNGDTGSGGSSAASTPSTVKSATRPERVAPTVPADLFDNLDSVSQISTQTYTVDMPGMSLVINADRGTPPQDGTAIPQAGRPLREHTPTRTGVGSKSPRPSSATGRNNNGNTTPKKTQSRLRRPSTPKSRPKSEGLSREDILAETSKNMGSMDQIDSQTVILSRSSSISSVDATEMGNENNMPHSPSRRGMRPSRLQRPSSSKARPDSLRLPIATKPR